MKLAHIANMFHSGNGLGIPRLSSWRRSQAGPTDAAWFGPDGGSDRLP